MKKNKLYIVVSFLALAVMILPAKSIFAKAETSGRERDDRNEIETGTLKRNDDDDEARTGTMKRDDREENEAETHRSAVAAFVQNLLKVADRNKGGIGEQVRVVAKEQEEAQATTSKAIAEVEGRSWLKTFLLGTDYRNLGMIRSEMVKTQSRIDKLNRLLETMTTSTGATTTAEQIQNLTQAQTKLEDFLKQNESKFSLFGWFVKLFNK